MKEGVRPFIMHLFCGLECEFPGEGGIYQRRMVCDTAILLIIDDEHHCVISPSVFEKVLVLIPQPWCLFVMDNNVVRILCILFLISKREERIRIHSLQLCVSLKSPLCIVPLIREGKEQPAGKEQSDAKQCADQIAFHKSQPFLNEVEIVDRIRSCGCHRKEHHSRNYQTNDSLHILRIHLL